MLWGASDPWGVNYFNSWCLMHKSLGGPGDLVIAQTEIFPLIKHNTYGLVGPGDENMLGYCIQRVMLG